MLRVDQGMYQFQNSFLSRISSRDVFVETQRLQNLISKCVILDIDHCAFGSHWRKATRLLFGGVLLVTSYPPMSFDATPNAV